MVRSKKNSQLVLIVDDESQHRQYIREVLQSSGISQEGIIEANSFELANKIIEQNEIYFIFCDLLVATEEDRKTYSIDKDQANAAKMPPDLIQNYIETAVRFISRQSIPASDEKRKPQIVVMTYFYDTPAIAQYRAILKSLGIEIMPKFFDSPDEIKAKGDEVLECIAKTLIKGADDVWLLSRKLQSAYEALSLNMEVHNITTGLASQWETVEDNLLKAFWNLLKISLILVIDINEPDENIILYYSNWSKLYKSVLLNEEIRRTLYLSVGSNLIHLSLFNVLASVSKELMTTTTLFKEVSKVKAIEVLQGRKLSQIEKHRVEELRSIRKRLENNLRFQILLLCLAHRTTPPIAIKGKPNKITLKGLKDSFDLEYLRNSEPFHILFEDWRRYSECNRNTLMELNKMLTKDSTRSMLGGMKKYKHLVLRVTDDLIPSYTRGGYYFNGGFVIKTWLM